MPVRGPGHRTRRFAAATLLLAAAALTYVSSPASLGNDVRAPSIEGDPAGWVEAAERHAQSETPLIPGTEKRIVWRDPGSRSRTASSVVYLHGFSATRQEIAPVAELLAEALDANLFETRLRGHGQVRSPLTGARAEDWLADAAEALAIGASLGDRVVVMGTSTGATLALAMAGHETFESVAALLLVSPNFGPADGRAEFLTWPGGPWLAELLVGETRSWTPWNELQGRYWSTSYPTAATVEMMRLVKHVRSRLPLQIDVPVLTFYSPSDTVINVEKIRTSLELLDVPRAVTIEISESGDPSNHVLAGDILSRGNNTLIVEHSVRFLRESGL